MKIWMKPAIGLEPTAEAVGENGAALRNAATGADAEIAAPMRLFGVGVAPLAGANGRSREASCTATDIGAPTPCEVTINPVPIAAAPAPAIATPTMYGRANRANGFIACAALYCDMTSPEFRTSS